MTRRSQRVEDLLRLEISQLLQRRVADPRLRLSSVSSVTVSPDLRRAVIRLSLLGGEAEREAGLAAARRARGYLRGELSRRLRRMRRIPDLEFRLDRGAEHSQHITDLLEGLESHDEPT